MIVKGDRIYLRAVLENDLNELLLHENDIEERGPFFAVRLTSQPAFRREFERTGFLSEDSGRLLICNLEDRLLGDLLYFRATPYFDGYEIGYRLFRLRDSGQGVMSEALALMTYLLFATRKINRLELKINPEHAASRRVAEKNGYRFEGMARQAYFDRGAYHDMDILSILRSEAPASVAEALTRIRGVR
jgi:RimJ/RimL family protein N-acetyltransferase